MTTAWKALERLVAVVLEGVRSWDTDHDVLLIADDKGHPAQVMVAQLKGGDGSALLALARMKIVDLASVEVKNLTAPTVAQLEAFLIKNRQKADRDGVRYSALVVKRKAGPGRKTMALLVVPLEEYRQ